MNRSIEDLLEQEAQAEAISLPDSDSVTDLTALVAALDVAQKHVDDLEEELKQAKKVVSKLSQNDIPEVFNEMGSVRSLKLHDGREVEVVEDFSISITKANQPQAFDWLRANNKAEIIKRSFTLQFDRGQQEDAAQAESVLLENNLSYSDVEKVHPQTLKASMRGIIESGETPPDSMTYYPYKKTVIK